MDARFKFIFLVAVLFMTALPLIGILQGPEKPPSIPGEEGAVPLDLNSAEPQSGDLGKAPLSAEMVLISAGEFIRGTNSGGYNEKPEHVVYLDSYWIDKYEVTNHQYQKFVEATGHRKAGLPSRYARKLAHLKGLNQPVAYVSWYDAEAYCQWRGMRLPNEMEWEKAVRGTDGRLWPWGEGLQGNSANFGENKDGFEYTAPVGSFPKDQSVFGVFDGAGNLMEWVDDWYVEQVSEVSRMGRSMSPGSQTYKTMRGGGYTSRGIDLRITNRSFMVPDFRDETIGFRCATSDLNQQEEVFSQPERLVSQRKSK